ncbi:MAG TPA: cytochrome c biogenesis protein CcdA [Symbiobacteriaceae bacterium]|jgi:cytochrome c-type biogenesis protein
MSEHVAAGRPVSGWRVAFAALIAILLAASWMLLSLVAGKSGLGKAVTAQSSGQAAVAQTVSRTGVTNRGTKIDVLFAVPEYYERLGLKDAAAEADPAKYLVFIVTEQDHDALAPVPEPKLVVNGQLVNAPVKDRVLSDSDHHRTRLIRFVRMAPDGSSYLPADAQRIQLAWPGVQTAHRADHSIGYPLEWEWPLVMPSDAKAGPLNLMTFLLLTAGLFAALSPCLIQLTLYYMSALAGTTTPHPGEAAVSPAESRRRVLLVAFMFVAGISSAYVVGGVMAGLLGRSLQVSNVLGEYGKWIAVAAGLFIIWMGFRAVAASQAPLVCKMPMPLVRKLAQWKMGPVTPFLMGFLMSLGCLQCFGGAIFASLLLYVGSFGSPGLGGLMLFVFSLGIAVPFLLAAFMWEKVSRVLAGVGRVTQVVSLASGVLMMTFGVLMVMDRFHWVSGVVIGWLPFLRT